MNKNFFTRFKNLDLSAEHQKTVSALESLYRQTGKLNSSQSAYVERIFKQYNKKKTRQLKMFNAEKDYKIFRNKNGRYVLYIYYENDDLDLADQLTEKTLKEHPEIQGKINVIIRIPKELRSRIGR